MISRSDAKVDTPATLSSSSSVCPSTSSEALISTFPPKVDIPNTLKEVKIPLLEVMVLENKVLVLKFSETYALPNTVKVSVGDVVPIPTDCS